MSKRIDAIEKVTGRAIYSEDIFLPKILYAVPLHAGTPSAKINNIDTSKALKVKGVSAILTVKDVTGEKKFGTIKKDHYFFVDDRINYSGDVLAVIVGTSLESAYKGKDAINIDVQKLPPTLSPLEAFKEKGEESVCTHFKVRFGDSDNAFKTCDKIVEREYKTTHIEHAYMEPEACVAIPNKDGSVTVRGGMQHPFTAQKFVASVTGLPLEKVQIIQTTTGGGFGGKDDTISLICARTALAAIKTKHPVKMVYTREESITESYKRHPFYMRYQAGILDNSLNALEVDIIADAGAYCSTSPFVIWRPTVQCTGPYLYPNVKCDSRAIYTNNTFTGAMRGFGSPQINFAIESFMDEIAFELKEDPIRLRKRYFFTQNCTTHTGQKLDNHQVAICEVVEKTLQAIGWDNKFAKCSHGKPDAEGNYYGIGMACSYRGVSLGAEGDDFCAAKITVLKGGKVQLEVGVAENGQGLKTVMAKICANELKIPMENIIYKDVDTLSLPDSRPTVASRGTLVGGNAVIDAAKKILDKTGGAPLAGFEGLCELGTWHGPKVGWEEETGQGNAYFTYVYGCQAVELKVEGKTGKVKVMKMVGAHDMGKAINEQMAKGQIFGGMVMGMGFALKEAIIHKDGVIQNTNFDGYKIVNSSEVPEMEAIVVENQDPAGPYGAKALGEPVNELMGGAIANAIFYATGVRFRELPITAEKILARLSSPL